MAMWQHSGQWNRSWSWRVWLIPLFPSYSFSFLLPKCRTDDRSTRSDLGQSSDIGMEATLTTVEQKERRHLGPWWPWNHHISPGLLTTGIPLHERKTNFNVSKPLLFWFFCLYADELNPNQYYHWLVMKPVVCMFDKYLLNEWINERR